jgi:histidyl-tRNA synthetase
VGEHFRYERPQKGRLRAFYQMNADILGEGSVLCDGELLALLVSYLRELGFAADDFQVRLSDRQLWFHLLARFGLAGEEAAVLSVVDKMEREDPQVTGENLAKIAPHCARQLLEAIDALRRCNSLEALEHFFAPDGNAALGERLAQWRTLLKFLGAMGLGDFFAVDPAIVRGLAYYSGFVFEAFERSGEGRALAGGGRYDALVGKLCGTELPACGFAVGDVTLTNLLREKNLTPQFGTGPDYWLVFGEEHWVPALSLADGLRRRGARVAYSLRCGDSAAGRGLKGAHRAGAQCAVIFGGENCGEGQLILRHMGTGTDTATSAEALLASRNPGA